MYDRERKFYSVLKYLCSLELLFLFMLYRKDCTMCALVLVKIARRDCLLSLTKTNVTKVSSKNLNHTISLQRREMVRYVHRFINISQ